MNTKNVLMLIIGAAIGAGTASLILHERYRKLMAVKEEYEEKETLEEKKEAKEDSTLLSYKNELAKYRYNDMKKEGGEPVKTIKPYSISPEEYEDTDGEDEAFSYDKISLTYYSDGILADEQDEVMDDLEMTVGTDFAEHFGEFGEKDAIYIRNDVHHTDYEIIRDLRTYKEVTGNTYHDSSKT